MFHTLYRDYPGINGTASPWLPGKYILSMNRTIPCKPLCFRFIFIVATFAAAIKMEYGLRGPSVHSSPKVSAPIELVVNHQPDYWCNNNCLSIASDRFPLSSGRPPTYSDALIRQATGALIVIERCAKAACSARTFLSRRTRSFPSSDEDPALV
jgi:hypothetical protein